MVVSCCFYFIFSRSTLTHDQQLFQNFCNKQNAMVHWIGFASESNKSICIVRINYIRCIATKCQNCTMILLFCVFRKFTLSHIRTKWQIWWWRFDIYEMRTVNEFMLDKIVCMCLWIASSHLCPSFICIHPSIIHASVFVFQHSLYSFTCDLHNVCIQFLMWILLLITTFSFFCSYIEIHVSVAFNILLQRIKKR